MYNFKGFADEVVEKAKKFKRPQYMKPIMEESNKKECNDNDNEDDEDGNYIDNNNNNNDNVSGTNDNNNQEQNEDQETIVLQTEE
jgi:hypothetical protein